MIAKLVAAAAVVVTALPALAADIDVRAGVAPGVYVEQTDPLYVPGRIVAASPPAIATAPPGPRAYVYPADSYAYYSGPVLPPDNGVVVERTVPLPTYLTDPVGPVCTPGDIVRGPDGRTWLCQ